jgi:hypothetical protein
MKWAQTKHSAPTLRAIAHRFQTGHIPGGGAL